jgi:hypothetical protein
MVEGTRVALFQISYQELVKDSNPCGTGAFEG